MRPLHTLVPNPTLGIRLSNILPNTYLSLILIPTSFVVCRFLTIIQNGVSYPVRYIVFASATSCTSFLALGPWDDQHCRLYKISKRLKIEPTEILL